MHKNNIKIILLTCQIIARTYFTKNHNLSLTSEVKSTKTFTFSLLNHQNILFVLEKNKTKESVEKHSLN